MTENERVKVEEINLEDLIILGDDRKIPVHITYPNADGTTSKAKALVKQLTISELKNLNVNDNNLLQASITILQKSLFKSNGESFTVDEINVLPVGIANAVAKKIMELSGVDEETIQDTMDF